MFRQYDSAVQAVLGFFEKNGMSKTVRNYFQHDVRVLKEYLAFKGLVYSRPIVQTWLATTKPGLTRKAFLSLRRSIALVEEAIQHGEVRSWHFDYESSTPKIHLQDYSRRLLNEYLARRAREGCQHSTLQMDERACVRFLHFIQTRGIDDPAYLTPELIKAYHVQARHRTPEGKNAYTYRIRGFVRFLAEKGIVSESLERSFVTDKAARVRIVSILSPSQIATIRSQRDLSSTPSELRSAAMALLALRMGLRSSDICALCLSDISWESATISIKQRKTGAPLALPLPVEAGNALARYILKGRPDCDIPNIFITLKRPYTAIQSSRCYRSSVSILGKKKAPDDIRGLHIARRTFASNLLAASNPVSVISSALGHSDPSSVDEYLATDTDRIRLCATGLAGLEPAGALV